MRIDLKGPFDMSSSNSISIEDFCRFLGIRASQFPKECEDLLLKSNLSFRRLTKNERDTIIARILKNIDSPDLTVTGDKTRWERGWNENLENFVASGFDLNKLVPKYIRPKEIIRLNGDYALPFGPNFELEYYTIFRRWLFRTYLNGSKPVYEFGCGSGYNLIELAQLYPDRELHGLDWVAGPINILKCAREQYGYNVTGHIFDMFHPDRSIVIPKGAVFLALCSLEQLGKNFEPFLQYALRASPSIFIHVDSIIELYDTGDLFDFLATKFNQRRNYLNGYLTRLRQLENEGVIEILNVQRSQFGNLYHDGYSFIIWRPKQCHVSM